MFTVLRIVHKTAKRGVCLSSELVSLNGALLVGCCACYLVITRNKLLQGNAESIYYLSTEDFCTFIFC